MGMLLDGSGAGTVQGKRAVAIHAQLVGRLSQLGVVIGTVHIVAAKAGHPAAVHYALYEIISLHAVLMSRAVRIVRERGFAQGVFFKLPKILQF